MNDLTPLSPCPHPPRSADKIACLAERARLRLPLFHADDNADDAEPADLHGIDQAAGEPTGKRRNAELTRQALAEGWTVRQLAEAMGCCLTHAHNWMKALRNGESPDENSRVRRRLASPEGQAVLREGLEKGRSLTQLASALCCSRSAVAGRLNRLRAKAAS